MRRALLLSIALAIPLFAQAQSGQSDPLGMQVVISIQDRRLWVVDTNGNVLLSASAAVGSGRTVRTDGRSWTFRTPQGATTVIAKETNPVWVPPDWHYLEVARQAKLALDSVSMNRPVPLRDGKMLVVRGDLVGVLSSDSTFAALPPEEEIIFGGTLYIPPYGTRNRRVEGVLGPYRLLLANGVGIHGTPFKESIGKAVTHGCIRLHDEDITWLYEHVAVGARVIIY